VCLTATDECRHEVDMQGLEQFLKELSSSPSHVPSLSLLTLILGWKDGIKFVLGKKSGQEVPRSIINPVKYHEHALAGVHMQPDSNGRMEFSGRGE